MVQQVCTPERRGGDHQGRDEVMAGILPTEKTPKVSHTLSAVEVSIAGDTTQEGEAASTGHPATI